MWPHTSSDLAAWVGALGSVGAVVAAIWFSRLDQRRRADERRKARENQIESAMVAARWAKRAADAVRDMTTKVPLSGSGPHQWVEFMRSPARTSFEPVLARIRAVQMPEIADENLEIAFQRLETSSMALGDRLRGEIARPENERQYIGLPIEDFGRLSIEVFNAGVNLESAALALLGRHPLPEHLRGTMPKQIY